MTLLMTSPDIKGEIIGSLYKHLQKLGKDGKYGNLHFEARVMLKPTGIFQESNFWPISLKHRNKYLK